MSRRHLLVGFIDQGVVSLTSLLVLASAAQYVTPYELGLFSIGLSSVLACVAITRTVTGETLLVRVTSAPSTFPDDESIRREASKALGLACLMALAACLLLLVIALLWTDARPVLLAASVTAVAVIGQDTVRHVCISRKHGAVLLLGDALVLILSVAAILVLGRLSGAPEHMILAWGVACALGSTVIGLVDGIQVSVAAGARWFRLVWSSSSAFALEAVLGAVAGYAIVVVLGVWVSPTQVAGYRTALSVFGLTSVIISALKTVVLRELTPSRLSSRAGLWKTFGLLSTLVVVVCLLTFIFVIAMPVEWGQLAFGETWPLVVALAPFAAVNRLSAGLSVVPLVFLRVQGVTWAATKVRLKLVIVLCIAAPVSAATGGTAGAFLAEAFMYLLVTVFLMRLVIRGLTSSPN